MHVCMCVCGMYVCMYVCVCWGGGGAWGLGGCVKGVQIVSSQIIQ
jgi:hypothetical protein